MSQFIAANLKYPEEALSNRIEGTVVTKIDISYKGKVVAARVLSALGHGCDAEAKRVVKLLEFDIESKIRKGKVLYHKTINIHFRLPETKSDAQSTQYNYQIVPTQKGKSSRPNITYVIQTDQYNTH